MKFLLKKCLRKKAPEMKPGAILDAVISQSSATACKCLLYKLADYKRGECRHETRRDQYNPSQSGQVAISSMPSIRAV